MFKKVYSLYSAFYPSLRFTLSLQSAFYPWSAVCSLRFTLTEKRIPSLKRMTKEKKTKHFSKPGRVYKAMK